VKLLNANIFVNNFVVALYSHIYAKNFHLAEVSFQFLHEFVQAVNTKTFTGIFVKPQQ